jgi:hypothetical protein
MPFYWIAGTPDEKKTVLLQFLQTETKTLVIIEKSSKAAHEIIEGLHVEGYLPCTVKFTTGCETYTFEGEGSRDTTKKIILHTGLDGYSMHLLASLKPTLAIFT